MSKMKKVSKNNQLPPDVTHHLKIILKYLEYEKIHWEELNKPKNHIWVSVKRLKKWVER